MVSSSFKKVFLIRFFAYLASFIGVLAILFEFGPLISSEFFYRFDRVMGQSYIVDPELPETVSAIPSPEPGSSSTPSPTFAQDPGTTFGNLAKTNAKRIKPVSTDYGIVIEKINANAKIVENVNPGNEKEYTKALSLGVAEAAGSTKPGENGNLFIFSHSADAPWNIVRFNAVFYLLRELVPGDKVILFYQGRRYDYIVFDKSTTNPKDLTFLSNRYDQPVLTLQTCDPPGTLKNRLIVRAKLIGT